MQEIIYPTITSVPRINSEGVHTIIHYAESLDFEYERGELEDVIDKYPDISELKLILLDELIDEYDYADVPEHAKELMAKLLQDLPHSLYAKIVHYNYRRSEATGDTDYLIFKEIFSNEISSLLMGDSYQYIVTDACLLRFFRLLMEYCHHTNDKDGIAKIYRYAHSMEWYYELETLSFLAVGKEDSNPVDMSDFPFVESWYHNLSFDFPVEELRVVPYDDIFYKVLNRHIISISDEDIAYISAIENRDKLLHDVCWVLHQGCQRFYDMYGSCSGDFIIHTLYISCHHKLAEMSPIFANIYKGIPSAVNEQISGDYGLYFLTPWLYELGKISLSGWADMLKYVKYVQVRNEERFQLDCFLYSKLYWLNALVKLSKETESTSQEASALLSELWEFYENTSYKSLGWLMYYIVGYGIDDYDERIKSAYNKNKIEIFVHGTFEDTMSDKDKYVSGFFELENLPEDIGNDYAKDIKHTARMLNKLYEPIDDIAQKIDSTVNNELSHHEAHHDSTGYSNVNLDNFVVLDLLDENKRITQKTIVRQGPKIGRNDPCPCGSGKKYKKCCL